MGATAVVGGHAYQLTGHDVWGVQVGAWNHHVATLGVFVFFLVSGYLVTGSFVIDPSPGRFAAKRVMRLWPGLVVMVIVVALVIGPWEAKGTGYLGHRDVWTFIVRNLLVVPYQQQLPGVFGANPEPAANATLWTLGVELACYVAVLLLGAAALLRRLLVGPVLAISLALALVGSLGLLQYWAAVRVLLVAFFLFGVGLRLCGSHRLRAPHATLGVALVLLSLLSEPLSGPLFVTGLGLVVLWFGQLELASAQRLTSLGDPSYGTYIYGFTLQQLLIAHGLLTAQPEVFMLVSVGVSVAAGYLSWHLVERPAMRAGLRRLPGLARKAVSAG